MDAVKTGMAMQQATAAMTARPGAAAPDAAQTAAREFEAVFLTQTVEELFRNIDIGSFGGGHAEETWRSFLARAYADQLAGQGMTGIAQSVEATILAYQTAQRGEDQG
jgi:Rod binding domain-containing protein